MMKILHVNSYYSTSKFYKHFYDRQINNALDIEVYVPVSIKYSIPNYNFGEFTKIKKVFNEYDRFLFFLKQKKILRDIQNQYHINDISLIHAHSLFTNGYVAYRLNKIYDIPYIVAVRDTDLNTFFKKLKYLKNIGINILKNASNIILLSESYKNQLLNQYIPNKYKLDILKKIKIIPNGIDPYWLRNKYTPKKLNKEKTIQLIQVGEMIKRKNQVISMEVTRQLNENGGNFKITLVGKDTDKEIVTIAKNKSYVNYINHVTKEELLKLYRDSDIFLMPSITETFGLVYAEAMTQGLPVLYSENQGFDKQFDEGKVGYSVGCFDIEGIKNTILETIDNYDTLSENAINNSVLFNWDIINKKYMDIYDCIINQINNHD